MPQTNRNKLVAVVFDDPYKAEEARAALHRMGGEGLLEIDETALIAKYPDGKTRVSQDVNIAANGEKVGHIAGLLSAAVTGTFPFIVAGTLGGWLVGKLTDHGITNAFMDKVKKEVGPGKSANAGEPELLTHLPVLRPTRRRRGWELLPTAAHQAQQMNGQCWNESNKH